MKKSTCITALLILVCSLSFASQEHKDTRPSIYDVMANGSEQIEKALASVKNTNKVVMLQFGANWCGWCHKLHGLFASDKTIAVELKKSYVVVLIDVDKDHNAEVVKKYDNPVRFGLPVIVLLDKNGKALTTQDTGKLEEGDHHDPAKVLAFLRQWARKK
jgi:thiol:disulfide interchange protein